MSDADIRSGEIATLLPPSADASLYFIGHIRTPWSDRASCPKRSDLSGPVCRLDIDPRWIQALQGLNRHLRLEILYWMDQARRDLVLQRPHASAFVSGTFALRSPVRPNPIASSIVALERVEGVQVFVRGLDCVDGTPLIDVKPEFCPVTPAPSRA